MFRILFFALCGSALLFCQSRAMPPADAIRDAEVRERQVFAEVYQPQREAQSRQLDYRRQFAARFNQLVDAVAVFSKRYNEGNGNVWPQREADKLRKAIVELQRLERSLRQEPAH